MKMNMNRRDFLGAVGAAGVAVALSRSAAAAPFKTTLQKALIGNPTEETLSSWKAAGFAGMETSAWDVAPEDAEKGRRTAEKLGMKIHSVLRGWTNFNADDPSAVAKDIASVERALKAAQGYGADALLLVPCRVGGMAMPEAWEFDIEFDEKTSHVRKVASGDNSKYEQYIAAQNRATDASRIAVEKLIPVAEKAGVIIALENVWNNLWVKPALCQNFVASFKCKWVQAYFDIGNHVKYAPPQEWIRTLGKLIVKCHVKDFKLNDNGHGGNFVDIRDGSIDWPEVRKALDEIGYNGWMTIEGSEGLGLKELNSRLDLIVSGK
jgi:hexulose-6-phosphate isomerase